MTSAVPRHRGWCCILGGPAASAAPGRAVPGTEDQLRHLPAEPGCSVPPTPSLAPPGTGAAPVPLAQAAARGRWPWHSQRRPWPAEDAEWHRLRRGLGSGISITPPWAGPAGHPGARHGPCEGHGRGEGPPAEPQPAPDRLGRFQGPAVISQGRSWAGCRTTSTPGLNTQIGYSPGGRSVLGNASVPGQNPNPNPNPLHPGTKLPLSQDKIPLRPSVHHIHSHCPSGAFPSRAPQPLRSETHFSHTFAPDT